MSRHTPTDILLFVALVLMTAGCGTVINGTNQKVTFASNPSDATVFVDGVSVGTTPTATTLARSDLHTIRIEKPGYVPYETTTILVANGADAGHPSVLLPFPFNLIGLVGETVADNSTGGAFDIRPTDISANLLDAADHPAVSSGTTASAPRFGANPDGSLSPIEPSQ